MEKLIQKKNVLLVKDDVGKAKPCVFKIPQHITTFGKPDDRSQEGAGKITSSWQEHNKSKSFAPQKDFRKMNKFGVSQKAVSHKSISYLICHITYLGILTGWLIHDSTRQ